MKKSKYVLFFSITLVIVLIGIVIFLKSGNHNQIKHEKNASQEIMKDDESDVSDDFMDTEQSMNNDESEAGDSALGIEKNANEEKEASNSSNNNSLTNEQNREQNEEDNNHVIGQDNQNDQNETEVGKETTTEESNSKMQKGQDVDGGFGPLI